MTERDIFLALLDLPDPADRTDYLDEVCGGNSVLRARVESLLRLHETAGSFLDVPAVAPVAPGAIPTVEIGSETPPNDRTTEAEDLTFLAPPGRPGALTVSHPPVVSQSRRERASKSSANVYGRSAATT